VRVYDGEMTEAPEPKAAAPDWADRMEQSVLDAALRHAPALGWSRSMVRRACEDNGLSLGDEELLLPNGPRDLAALLSRRHDDRAMAVLSELDVASLKIRERIARAVSARLEAGAADLDAAKRCAAFLALPTNADLGLKLAWESADLLWNWAGDTATDWNHYSKRTILSGILVPALTMRLFDSKEAADAFVSRRIDNVMTFEKWKAGKDFDAPLRKVTDLLSRIRYGAKTV
jgi:ubiquinone biosynthesis protein COQ9